MAQAHTTTMSPTLVSGRSHLVPKRVEFHPLAERSAQVLTLERQVLFGPVRQEIAGGGAALWWGSFRQSDQVAMTIYARKEACLRLRILDFACRPLKEVGGSRGTERLAAVVARNGLVFFHVVNEGASDAVIFFQVAQGRSVTTATIRPPESPLKRWTRRLPHIIRGAFGSGVPLEAKTAR